MTNLITDEMIKDKINQHFIKPTNNNKNYIGIEIEMPILNLNKKAVDFNTIHKTTQKFKKHFTDFQKLSMDYDGNIFSLKNEKTDDILCYDCSYNNIEFAMGPEKDLFTINDRFKEYYTFIKESFEEFNHTVTGMGINPYRQYNKEIPIPSERYLMLYHHLESYKNYQNPPIEFHDYPGYGMFSSASQVQLDVNKKDLVETINTFSKIEPIKALLFSNSVFYEENPMILCYRDLLWENSTHGINPRNIGMYDEDFKSLEEFETYLQSLNIYCVVRDGSYINFQTMSLNDYFSKENIKGEKYADGHYEDINVKPSIEDIKYLRPFKFINLTFRGTIEFRSVCTQPIKDSMTVAAFHLGLNDQLDNLSQLINEDTIIYHKGYTATQLRKLLIQKEIPEFINQEELYKLSKQIVDLASDTLIDRGMGEEVFLKPLYERIRKRTNPGKNIVESIENGNSIEKLIKEYS